MYVTLCPPQFPLVFIPTTQVNAQNIFDFRIDPSPDVVFSSEIADAIHQLFHDPMIPTLMDHHSSELYLMDSAV